MQGRMCKYVEVKSNTYHFHNASNIAEQIKVGEIVLNWCKLPFKQYFLLQMIKVLRELALIQSVLISKHANCDLFLTYKISVSSQQIMLRLDDDALWEEIYQTFECPNILNKF